MVFFLIALLYTSCCWCFFFWIATPSSIISGFYWLGLSSSHSFCHSITICEGYRPFRHLHLMIHSQRESMASAFTVCMLIALGPLFFISSHHKLTEVDEKHSSWVLKLRLMDWCHILVRYISQISLDLCYHCVAAAAVMLGANTPSPNSETVITFRTYRINRNKMTPISGW